MRLIWNAGKVKTVYKVVLDDKGMLRSCSAAWCTSDRMKQYLIKYEVGKWIMPNQTALEAGYGILVFEELLDAIYFCWGNEMNNLIFRIYQCETRCEMPLPVCGYDALLHALIYKSAVKSDPITRADWPRGTVSVSAIRLVREIQVSEIIDHVARYHLAFYNDP